MKKAVAVVVVVCVLVSVAFFNVYAIPPPMPTLYKIEVDGGDKVFVMLYNRNSYESFQKSGLYINEEPYEAIYLLDEDFSIEFSYGFHLSDCGIYFAYIPRRVSGYVEGNEKIPTAPAISFYAYGEMYHSYEITDLMTKVPNANHNVSNIQWDYGDYRTFYNGNILSVTTLEEKTIYFDITTGQIVTDEINAEELVVAEIIKEFIYSPYIVEDDSKLHIPLAVGAVLLVVIISIIKLKGKKCKTTQK